MKSHFSHEALARIIVDEMFGFVGLFDTEGRFLEVNRTALDGCGLTWDEVKGKFLWEVPVWKTPTDDFGPLIRASVPMAAKGEFFRREVDIMGGDRGRLPVTIDYSIKPVSDADGKVIFLVAEGRNIMEKKLAELEIARKNRELENLNRQLVELDKQRSTFFANISHELRTPLTLILAPLETLLQTNLTLPGETRLQLIRTVHNNAVRLLQMITGLLDFSKLHAGKIEVQREPVALVKLTQTVLEDFQPAFRQKAIAISFRCELPDLIVSLDRYLYERVLFNLLSNALKFTPPQGSISVSLAYEDEIMTLIVKDSGIGISDSDQKILFERFRQVDASSTRRFEGTGLGLALVREFAELMDGTITVRSEKGVGSEFCFRAKAPQLPVPALSEIRASRQVVYNFFLPPTSNPETPEMRDSLRVIVAEDNDELAAYIRSILEPLASIRTVKNGREALDLIAKWKPDLVLSDIMMPGVDGLSLCKEVKAKKETKAILVVLLTALTHRDSLIDGWQAGADDYLFKPFHPLELTARVRTLLALARERREREHEPGSIQQPGS